MNVTLPKIIILLLASLLFPVVTKGQLPICSVNGPVYLLGGGTQSDIFTYNPSQPMVAGVNPAINTVSAGGEGLAVSPNLNSPSPGITFYTTQDGFFYYYNGVAWVNTGHHSGSGGAINLGGGGGYIFNYDVINGDIWRYDGTADATVIANISALGCVYDIAADCYGNFYILRISTPQKLTKYNSAGLLLDTYTVTGASHIGYGSGLAVMGNDVYYFDTTLMHGVIAGNTLNFFPPMPNVGNIASSDIASCPGIFIRTQPVIANVCSDELPYNWSGQAYFTAGNYQLTYTGSSGCDSVVELDLTVNPSPPLPVTTASVTYCLGDAAIPLAATGTGNILWYQTAVGGNGSVIPPVPLTNVPGITNYYVSQQNGNCESQRIEISVQVYGVQNFDDKEITVCNDSSVDLNPLYNTNGFTANWTLDNIVVPNPGSVSVPGAYQLVISNSFGCMDTALVSVIVQPPIFASAGTSGNADYNIPYQLYGNGGVTYEWSPAYPLNDAHLQNPLAVLTNDITFYLTVKDNAGCTGLDSIKVKVLNGTYCIPGIPNAITPNGDGINDQWIISQRTCISKIAVSIYNRYGSLVYHSDNYKSDWKGTYQSKECPDGTYYYVIKTNLTNGKEQVYKGDVTILR